MRGQAHGRRCAFALDVDDLDRAAVLFHDAEAVLQAQTSARDATLHVSATVEVLEDVG